MSDWMYRYSSGDTWTLRGAINGWWWQTTTQPTPPQEPAAPPARRTFHELTERRRLARLRRQWQRREDR